MRIQEAYQTAMELHQQGLGAMRIHNIMPFVKVGRIYSWISSIGAKPSPEPNLTSTPSLAYILGVLYGDGSVTRYPLQNGGFAYTFRLKVTDKEFIDSFKSSLGRIGLHSSRVYIERRDPKKWSDMYYVKAYSKPFYRWFKGLSWDQLYKFLQTTEMKREFIRGFYESEGHVSRSHPKRKNDKCWRVGITNTNFELITLIQRILNDLGFFFFAHKGKMRLPRRQKYELRLYKREDVKRFLTEIGSCIPRKSLARLEGELC